MEVNARNYIILSVKAIFILFLFACKSEPKAPLVEVIISPNDGFIQYTGRIDWKDSLAPMLHWAGNSARVRFTGSSVKVRLSDPSGLNYFNTIIDGDDGNILVIDCDSSQEIYPIATNLEDSEHELLLVRRTDPIIPGTAFLGIVLSPEKKLLPPPPRPTFKIEFYGNSITSGQGVLDETRENNKDLATWDNYWAYPGIASRLLDAEYHCISRSGIGIIKSWYPLTMPYMYDRVDPADPARKWDYTQWKPDLIVVNLFQNDSWLLKQVYPEQVVRAYVSMVESIRRKYPNKMIPIICTLGNMDITKGGSPWPGYVKDAVGRMKAPPYNDAHVYSLFFPYKRTGGHPVVSEQEDIAELLVDFVEENGLL